MFLRLRPLLAVTASLTLCLLAYANPAAAQNLHDGQHGAREGGAAHHVMAWQGNASHSPAARPNGLRPSLRGTIVTRRDAVSGYGLHASAPLALPPNMREGSGGLAAAPLNGGALNAEPVRSGSLRADIARYNAERAGHGMDVPRPPSTYSSNLYTN